MCTRVQRAVRKGRLEAFIRGDGEYRYCDYADEMHLRFTDMQCHPMAVREISEYDKTHPAERVGELLCDTLIHMLYGQAHSAKSALAFMAALIDLEGSGHEPIMLDWGRICPHLENRKEYLRLLPGVRGHWLAQAERACAKPGRGSLSCGESPKAETV